MTEIVHNWPPNILAIRAVLPVTIDNIFAYEGKIYSPGSWRLSPELIAHENVHFRQQAETEGGAEAWWDRFLADKKFRLDQEIPAHQVEWRVFLRSNPGRKERRVCLKVMAKRLAGSMYGSLISTANAKKVILNEPR